MERLGAAALLDARAAATASTDRGALLALIRADANLLRLPIVRHGGEMTAGQDETTWRAWLARRKG